MRNRHAAGIWLTSLFAGAFALLSAASLLAASAPPTVVRPSQEAEGTSDEASLNARRTEWMERIHRAAPGTDWRAIEQANRMESILRRENSPQAHLGLGQWTERGALNVTGRNWCSALSGNGFNLYVGSANGGLFRGNVSGGGAWTPLSDNIGYAVEHVAVIPGAPDQLVTADNGRVFRSPDGGNIWSVPTGLPEAIWYTHRLVQEADTPTTMFLLVDGWIWLGASWDHNQHLLRSTDGGATWTRVHSEPLATVPDMWVSRTGASALYLAVGNVLKKSVDHGVTFTVVGSLPSASERVKLVGSEAGAPQFYAALQNAGAWTLYSSANAGLSWTSRGPLTDFYGTLFTPMTDATQVFYGGINCHRSTNSGASFSLINEWFEYYSSPDDKLHADIFGMTSHIVSYPPTRAAGGAGIPFDELIMFHTDGGTYSMPVTGTTPGNLTRFGFSNAQYYSVLSTLGEADVLSAGSQDQGYQIAHPDLATTLPDLTQMISGDYGHLTSSWPDRSRMVWSVYPGFILLQTGVGATPDLEFPSFPSDDGIQFLPYIVADPDDPNSVLFCARHIWRITRTGPGTYTQTMLPMDFGVNAIVASLAIAPSDHSRWYAVTYDGSFYRSDNHGATWTITTASLPDAHYFYGSEILVSSTEKNLVYVGGAGYSNPAVYRSTDGGSLWTAFNTGLPSTLVFGLVFESHVAENTLYAATEAGPYRYDSGSGQWQSLLSTACCAPMTSYWDVESIEQRGIVRFATYGRGIWDYATFATLDTPKPDAGPSVRLAISPNPTARASQLDFDLPNAGRVQLEVFDVAGHRLATPFDGWHPAGHGRVAFSTQLANGRTLDPGIYLVRLKTESDMDVRKLLIAK